MQPFASSQIVLYNEKQAARKENQHNRATFSSSRNEKLRQMYLSMIQEATFNFLSSLTGLAWSENFGTKRHARGRCRTFIVFGHLCSLAYESQGWREHFREEDLLGRMLESFACSTLIHPQLFLGSTVANLGLLPDVAGRFEIEKSLTFRWHGLP